MSEETQTPETPVEQTPNQPVAVKSYLTETGEWNREAFEAGLGEHSIFDKYKNPEELVKATINKDNLIGKKAEDFWTSDDADLVARRREIMGVPAEASEYEYEAVEFAEGMPVEAINGRIEAAKEKFKELGINKAQAKALLEWDLEGAVNEFNSHGEAVNAQRIEAEAQLKAEWKGDKFEYNVQKAKNALDHLGLGEWADNPAMGNNPQFIKDVFDKLVPLISDDTIIEARQSQNIATLQDELKSIDDRIWETPDTELNTQKYMNLVSQRLEVLNKMS